ncbi:MAG: hypothetical protein M3Q30_18775 [Actinomycetota bacterium]|nr:hypothetical protein [Actinomycetota bacterium]
MSARVGDSITLYVSTSAPVFRVEAYRMGWYQGLGGRLVWRSPDVSAKAQTAPTIAEPTRTVTARWEPSMRVHVSRDWVPGDYLLKLVSRMGQSYVPLTVRNDGSRSPVLVMNAVTTWQAYNDWGGHSLYFGPKQDRRTRSTVVSFDRPYNWAIRADLDPSAYAVCCGFLATELGVVTLVERLGLDVAYTTDVDVQEHPAQLLRHKVVVSGGHDEYWSVPKRDAVEAARDRGVNVMFLGPNAVYWRIRLAPSKLGKDRLEVNYRVARDDPLFGKDDAHVTTLWRSPPRPRPESTLTGMVFFCFGADNDGVVADATSWVFAGTGLRNGDHIPKLVQREADRVDKTFPTPPNVETLLHSPVSCLGIGGKQVGLFSDTTYYTAPSGAGVFAAGAQWDCRLYDGCPSGPRGPDRVVQRITENVLRAFAAGPAGKTHQSRALDSGARSP